MGMEKEISIIYDWLYDLLSEEDKKQMISHDVEDLPIHYSELIAWVGNNVLNKNNELYKFYKKMGVTHQNDMSVEIIEGFYGYLLYKTRE